MSNDLYRHFDKHGELLYVGISLSAVTRLSQHRDGSCWYDFIDKVTIEKFNSREEVVKAEKEAITKEHPTYNTQHNTLNPKHYEGVEFHDEYKIDHDSTNGIADFVAYIMKKKGYTP